MAIHPGLTVILSGTKRRKPTPGPAPFMMGGENMGGAGEREEPMASAPVTDGGESPEEETAEHKESGLFSAEGAHFVNTAQQNCAGCDYLEPPNHCEKVATVIEAPNTSWCQFHSGSPVWSQKAAPAEEEEGEGNEEPAEKV